MNEVNSYSRMIVNNMDELYENTPLEIKSEPEEMEPEEIEHGEMEPEETEPEETEPEEVISNILPFKSKKLYDKAYDNFKKWCSDNNIPEVSENCLIVYFNELAKSKQSSTLWATYSMIKSSLLRKENIDIKQFTLLLSFLKRNSVGYEPKKSKVFTKEQIEEFLENAPNLNYLMIKVATIIAVSGACRCRELLNLKAADVREDEGNLFVHIKDSTTNKMRSFVIVNRSHIQLCLDYMKLRPAHVTHDRFFIKYKYGKCTTQVVGKNKFGEHGCIIAKFLKLETPEMYTGHCFRRSSVNILAESGFSMTTLKRQYGWRSTSVAEGYIHNNNKVKVTQKTFKDTSNNTTTVLNVQPGPSSGGLLRLYQRERIICKLLSRSATGVARRTPESNPAAHSYDHIGLYYKLDDDLRKTLFGLGGLPKSYSLNLDTFGETCFMVRKPALDIITFLKKADYSKPAIRYLLFGKPGCGKSVSLAHVLHYAYVNEFVIVHVPWVWNWMRNERHEVTEAWSSKKISAEEETEIDQPSEQGSPLLLSKEKLMVDLPLVAAAWLKHFQLQNSDLLSKLKLETNEEYVWSQREVTEVGSPLTDLVSHGINRVKYACAVIQALIKQLKHHANGDRCRVLVAVDGFNAFFGDKTNLKREDRSRVSPAHITLTSSFLEATTNDWKNGAVVVTVDQLSGQHETLTSHYPLYLLGRQGFEHLDPFVSVQVKELSPKEVESMLDYYEDRKWIQRKGGRHELSFLSNSNPYQLMNLCAPL